MSSSEPSVASTDGLHFPIEKRAANRFFGAGVLIYIAQTVEPMRVDLAFSTQDHVLASGRICVGFREQPPVAWDSPEHYRLGKPLLANPKASFNWREEFDFAGGRWRRRAADGQFRWPIAQSPPK